LFYDPLLDFFRSSSSTKKLPAFDFYKLFLGLLFRFFLNTITSLAIIYVLFNDLENIKFASFLYISFFVLLIGCFFVAVCCFPEQKMIIFYIRRFLIQPLFLILFIPAFYFQKQTRV
jgi:exosortase F-associated protein